MTEAKTQIGEVTYNPATQSFEALVTFHTDMGRVRVASTFPAPLSTDFETASKGLWQNALAGLDNPNQMQARLIAPKVVPPRRIIPELRAHKAVLSAQLRAA